MADLCWIFKWNKFYEFKSMSFHACKGNIIVITGFNKYAFNKISLYVHSKKMLCGNGLRHKNRSGYRT